MRKSVGRIKWGTFRYTKDLGTTILADMEGGKDLVPVTVFNVHDMKLKDYAKAVAAKVEKAKKGKDKEHNQSTQLFNFVPSFIAEPILFSVTYLGACVGLNIPGLIHDKQIGHCVVTNIGTLGYNQGFAPLCPPMHAFALICCGKIEKRPIVNKQGEIVADDQMTVVATGDHRYGDAAVYAPFFKMFKGYLEDPFTFDIKSSTEHPHYTELKDKPPPVKEDYQVLTEENKNK